MKIVDFIEQKCVLPARSGDLYLQNYELLSWQKKAFSTMYRADGSVRVPNIYLIGARKTAKTDFAMLCLAYRFFHPDRRGETHTVSAYCESQAMILYEYFIELISLVPELKSQSKVRHDSVVHKTQGNKLKILTQSRRGAYGLFVNGININDEVGVYDEECFHRLEVLRKASVLAPEPQEIFLANVPEHSEHKSLDLLKEAVKSPQWQVKKFVASKRFSWRSPKCWATATPFYNYKKTPQVKKFYKDQYEYAKNGSRRSESEFKRLLLGWGTTLDNSRWIQPENLRWATEKQEKNIFEDRNISWSVGVDLSLHGSDSTSWCLVGMDCQGDDEDPLKDESQKIYLAPAIYYGNITRKKPSLRDKIREWSRQGYVTYQGGECIKQGPILDDVYALFENKWFHDDVEFVFDPAFSQPWIQAIQDDFRCKTITYSPKFMTRPIRVLQRKAEQKNVVLLGGRNPAVEWQCSNGVVNELSRNWCMLSRLNKNDQLNIDAFSASLLGLCNVLEIMNKPQLEVMVL